MFFRKKKETDVDVLQKIKDKITEDEQKKSNSGQKNAVTEAVDDELVGDGEGAEKKEVDVAEIGRSVLENVSQIVDKAIQDNNDQQNQFENSLESDFLNDVFAIADAKADEVMNVKSNNESKETDTVADANTTNTEDDDDDDADDFNFDDELGNIDDLQKDEESLLDDNDGTTEEIETLVISGDGTDDKEEEHNDKQEQKMLADNDKETVTLTQNINEEKNNQVVQKVETKKEEMQPVTKSDENDLLYDDTNAIEEIGTLVINGGDDETENIQASKIIKEEIKVTNASNIASSVGHIVEKQEPSNRATGTHKIAKIATKEENITFPNVPKMVKNDNTERKNVVSSAVIDEDGLHNNEVLNVNNGGNDMHFDVQNSNEKQRTTGISQQTQKGVKTSITDLIENVKNQIMQNNRPVASRGSRVDGSKTMEQFVADLVQPHIVRYLDGNLERIVNNIVQKEIKKIIDDVEEG